jgi:hypothetical protein
MTVYSGRRETGVVKTSTGHVSDKALTLIGTLADTALFRNPYYHTPYDTANRVDFVKMSRVVNGLRRLVESIATED